LLAAIVVAQRDASAGWWVFPTFGLGPDLAFLVGIGTMGPLQRGQMPPRAVPAYNALHRAWGPAGLAVLAMLDVVPGALLIGALVWAFHIACDRAVGYSLRTRDGWQRG
jgi:hypothetical protein